MQANTEHMSKTTDKMSDNTSQLLDKTVALNGDIKIMLTKMTDVADKMTEMNQTVKTLGPLMVSVEGQMTKTTEVVQTVGKQMGEMNKNVTELGKSVASVTNVVTQVGGQMTTVTSTVKEVGDKMNGLKTTIDDVSKNLNKTYGLLEKKIIPEMQNVSGSVTKKLMPKMDIMQNSIDIMNQHTNDMGEDVRTSYTEGRMNGSHDTRQKEIQTLKNSATSFEAKMIAAGTYFYSFEFQLWKPKELLTKRLALYTDAVMEFLGTLKDFAPNLSDYDIPYYDGSKSDFKNYSTKMNLLALAATAERINPEQIKILNKNHSTEKPMSMLQLIESSLIANKSGKIQFDYQNQALTFYPLMIYFLQMRHSILRAAAFTKAHVEDDGNQRAWKWLVWDGISRSNWTPAFKTQTEHEINQGAEFLEFANETRAFLRSLGVEPVEYIKQSTINGYLCRIDFSSFNLKDGSSKTKAILRFQKALSDFK